MGTYVVYIKVVVVVVVVWELKGRTNVNVQRYSKAIVVERSPQSPHIGCFELS